MSAVAGDDVDDQRRLRLRSLHQRREVDTVGSALGQQVTAHAVVAHHTHQGDRDAELSQADRDIRPLAAQDLTALANVYAAAGARKLIDH